jgi:rhodanese-related sulfurtransferase
MGSMRRLLNTVLALGCLGISGLLVLASTGWEPTAAEGGLQTRTVAVEGDGRYTDVSATVLARMLAKKEFLLVNVHIPYEGEIAGTDLAFPFDQVDANLARLPTDKSARVILYCRSGSMSSIAARALVKLGFTDVWNLDGGMIAWQEAGHPLAGTAKR